jgi:hypothetical protein
MKPSFSVRALLALFVIATAACDTAPAASRSQAGVGAAEAAAPGGLHVEDVAAGGEVDAVVRKALASATARRRHLVVYVGATWCEPCQRFHHAAQNGELDSQFPDVDILAFDADRDGERLAAAGYTWKKYIPLFALPGEDGRASGKQFEGGIKGEGAVSYLAPRLQALLAQ